MSGSEFGFWSASASGRHSERTDGGGGGKRKGYRWAEAPGSFAERSQVPWTTTRFQPQPPLEVSGLSSEVWPQTSGATNVISE